MSKFPRWMRLAASVWRRKAVQVSALLLFVLALRLAWGWWVGMRVEKALADLRQRGEPVAVTDIVYPYVAHDENAVTAQVNAAAALRPGVQSPRNTPTEYAHYPPYPPQWMKLAAASEQANGNAFKLLRQARQRSKVQFRRTMTSPAVQTTAAGYPASAMMRQLGEIVTDGAAYAHLNGDDVEALERLLDALHLARSLHHDDVVGSQFIAIGIEEKVCEDAHMIGPGLNLGGAAAGAARARVRELIDRLLDEQPSWDGARRAAILERAIYIDYCRSLAGFTWAIRPMGNHTILRMLPSYAVMVEAAERRTVPEARAVMLRGGLDPTGRFTTTSSNRRGVPRYSRWRQLSDWGSMLAIYVDRHFRIIAARRTAAVSLACQLYHADHGRFPERLDALVPDYLERLPADPFHGDGRPIGYVIMRGRLPDGGDRPMVYFDAGPAEEMIWETPQYTWYLPWNKLLGVEAVRQYRDLTRFTPPPEAVADPDLVNSDREALREFERAMGLSEEAVDDDPDQADAPGEDEKKEGDVP